MTVEHRQTVTKFITDSSKSSGGAYHLSCLCGWSGPWRDTALEAEHDFTAHLKQSSFQRGDTQMEKKLLTDERKRHIAAVNEAIENLAYARRVLADEQDIYPNDDVARTLLQSAQDHIETVREALGPIDN